MKLVSELTEVQASGEHVGWYFSGDWTKLPGRFELESSQAGQNARSFLHGIMKSVLAERGNRQPFMVGPERHLEADKLGAVVFAHPPFDQPAEAFSAGKAIEREWNQRVEALGVEYALYADSFVARQDIDEPLPQTAKDIR